MASYRQRLVRVLSALVIAASGLVAVLFVTAQPAFALGPGKVCVFNSPTGAEWLNIHFGHTGWGYLIGGTNQWVYGATENENALQHADKGHDIGYWDRQGTFQQMLNAFYDPSSGPQGAPTGGRIHVGYYRTYKCYSTTTSSVGAANNARHSARCGGYDVIGKNSLDATYNIIHAYNGSIPMPTPSFIPIPNSWYNALGTTYARFWKGPFNLTFDGSGIGADPGGHC